jgi:hypothetical protein
MRNTIRFLGFIALAAIMGFTMAGCGEKPGGGDDVINIAAIQGITAPVKDATPPTAITPTAQYTGTVEWDDDPVAFVASTVYTATITLAAKPGFTLQGVAANFFTVAGATSVTNAESTGVITAVFPPTGVNTGVTTVTGVIVSPNAVDVIKGKTQVFSATVNGSNTPPQTVTWTIETAGTDAGTSFAGAVMTVSANETKETLVVRATSTFDNTMYGEATVTVISPAAALVGKWYSTQVDANINTGTPLYEFTSESMVLKNGDDDDFIYSADSDTITITYTVNGNEDTAKFFIYGTTLTITEATGLLVTDGIYFKYTNAGVAKPGDVDFPSETVTEYNVTKPAEWEAARSAIATGGKNRNYVINIFETVTPNDVSVSDSFEYTFGNLEISEGITVSIRGTGTLALSELEFNPGNLLTIRNDHKVILRGLTLQGVTANDDALVVNNGTFIMQSGKITDNSNLSTDEYGNGGGVRNAPKDSKGGIFIMNGGEISGNSANNGGGVYNSGTFQISNGIIYGIGSADENTVATEKKSLFGSDAVLGAYANGTFTTNGKTIGETNFTIRVVNGTVPGTDDNISGSWWEGVNGTGNIKYDFTATGGIIIDGEESYYYYSAEGSTITFTNTATGTTSTSTFVINRYTLTFSDNSGGTAAFDDGSVYRVDPASQLYYAWRNSSGTVVFTFRDDGKMVVGSNEYDYSVSGNIITGGTGGQFSIRGTYLRLTGGSYAGTYYRLATSNSSLTTTYGWYYSPADAYDQGTPLWRFASGRIYNGGNNMCAYTSTSSTITAQDSYGGNYDPTTYSISGQVMTTSGGYVGNGRFFAR